MKTNEQTLTDEQVNEGLRLHGLSVDKPSQNADCFRVGMRYAARLLPAASEFYVDHHKLRVALSMCGISAPESNEALGLDMERHACRVIEFVAAHGVPAASEAAAVPVVWVMTKRKRNSDPKYCVANPSGIYESTYRAAYFASPPAPVEAGADACQHDIQQTASGAIVCVNCGNGAAAIAAAPSDAPAQQDKQNGHIDDDAVDHFVAAMKVKLAQARAKGRHGWHECAPELLSKMLREHVEKGDPRDVANFCMFLWSLGHPIAPAAQGDERAQWQISDERIKRLMAGVGMPNSMSLYQAFKQQENEIRAALSRQQPQQGDERAGWEDVTREEEAAFDEWYATDAPYEDYITHESMARHAWMGRAALSRQPSAGDAIPFTVEEILAQIDGIRRWTKIGDSFPKACAMLEYLAARAKRANKEA